MKEKVSFFIYRPKEANMMTYSQRHTIQAHVCKDFIDFGLKMCILCMNLYNNNEKIVHLYPQVYSQHFSKCSLHFGVAITLKLLQKSS